VDADGDVIARRHGRAIAEHKVPHRHAGHVVHGKHGVAGVVLEQAIVHHADRAATAFFGRLKNQVQRAVKFRRLRDGFGCGQQHGRVTVVATGMHQALACAGPLGAGGFLNGQGVHVGADAELALAAAALQGAHHTRATQTAVHLVAPALQLGRHQVRGAVFFKRQLGVAVDVTPQLDEFTHPFGERIAQIRHVTAVAS
jgi:hypothetical protein